jgi:hypothetical protein
MTTTEFEPVIPDSKRPQTHALDRSVTPLIKSSRLDQYISFVFRAEVMLQML